MSLSLSELEEYVRKRGCYCGGHGVYTEYNCGADFEVTCPHCRGTGRKNCDCKEVSLKCQR